MAKVKAVQDLKIVGQSPQRYDIPAKVDGSLKWAVDVKLPGMVHARNVKPPVAGAKLVSIDESSVRGLPGFVKVVSKGNYVAVVCEREEQAIKAAQTAQGELAEAGDRRRSRHRKTCSSTCAARRPRRAPSRTWSGTRTRRWRAPRRSSKPNTMFRSRDTRPSVRLTPLADPSNGQMTIYSNDMKSYGLRNGVAEFLRMPRDQVRVVWMEGPQGYGRTAADDAGFEAAFLAKEIGRPVRVQWMRNEETAWDTKGPAFTFKMRGALDAQGNLIASDYNARAADYNHLGYNEPDTVLIAQLMGRGAPRRPRGGAATPSDMYAIPNRRTAAQVVSLPLVWETPLRTGNLRDPNGPQVTFASESFIDELAAAAKADPVEFRLKLLTAGTTDDSGFKRARSIAVVKAAAEAYGWDTRPSPRPRRHREHSHRARHRLRLPQPDRGCARSPRSR